MRKITPANGTTGCLIHCNGTYMFRVYAPDKSFKDYTLSHSDLFVTIVDPDSEFVETSSGDLYLDHSSDVLGVSTCLR